MDAITPSKLAQIVMFSIELHQLLKERLSVHQSVEIALRETGCSKDWIPVVCSLLVSDGDTVMDWLNSLNCFKPPGCVGMNGVSDA